MQNQEKYNKFLYILNKKNIVYINTVSFILAGKTNFGKAFPPTFSPTDKCCTITNKTIRI